MFDNFETLKKAIKVMVLTALGAGIIMILIVSLG